MVRVIKVERAGTHVTLVELDADGIVLGFRSPTHEAYRYTNAQVYDRYSHYIPRVVYAEIRKQLHAIFEGGEAHETQSSLSGQNL